MTDKLQELYGQLTLAFAKVIDSTPELTSNTESDREKIASEADRLAADVRDISKKIYETIETLPGVDKNADDQESELKELKKLNDQAAAKILHAKDAAERWKDFISKEKEKLLEL